MWSLKTLPRSKCGSDSSYVDNLNIAREFITTPSRVTKEIVRSRPPNINVTRNLSSSGFRKEWLESRSRNQAFLPHLQGSRGSDTQSDSDDSIEEVQIGTEQHIFRSPAPRPMDKSQPEVRLDLMRLRRRSTMPQLRTNPISRLRDESSAAVFSKSCDKLPLRSGPCVNHSEPTIHVVQEMGGGELSQKIRRIKASVANALVRDTLQMWQEWHYDRMLQKQPIIDQYLGCCAYLKRSPFLKTQLRKFLLSPSAEKLDLSGFGITGEDAGAFICALAGRGCNMRPDRVVSVQEIRGALGDASLTRIDVSRNSLGAAGSKALAAILVKSGFLASRHRPQPQGPLRRHDLHAALTELDISGNAVGIAGSAAIKGLLAAPQCALRKLSAGSNMLADLGCATVFEALASNTTLASLDMSENAAANDAGGVLGDALERNTALTELNLAYNHLRTRGARQIGRGLSRNTALRTLSLQWNGFGDEDSVSALAKAIPACGVTELNLAHNRVRLRGASILASALERRSRLARLVLDGNPLGRLGARALFRALEEAARRGQEFPTSVSTVDCGTRSAPDGAAFDPSETAGRYELDLQDAYSRTVLSNLIRASACGAGSFLGVAVAGTASPFNATVGEMPVVISDCGSIDVKDWRISTGSGVDLPVAEETDEKGQPTPLIKTWARNLNRSEGGVTCVVCFTFKNERKRPTARDCLSEMNFELLRELFSNPDAQAEKCIETLHIVFGSDVFVSIKQAEELLGALSCHLDPARNFAMSSVRVAFLACCFHKIIESHQKSGLLEKYFSHDEQRELEKALGSVSFDFTPNNPTGYHKIDLSDAAQRDMCLRLIEIKNEMVARELQFRDFYATDKRAGGRRDDSSKSPDFERVWRNSKLDQAQFIFHDGWKVPKAGFLEVDFIALTKPDPPMPSPDHTHDQMFQLFFDSLKSLDSTERQKITLLRRYSNTDVFTCHQLAALLAYFKGAELRVEVCVIGYARTVDWHGFRNLVMTLQPEEVKLLQSRIGTVNLFDDVMAVGFYELDLAHSADRFVMQELLHLASMEPGDNIVDCIYQGIDYTVGASWIKDVPNAGVISLYYCREQQVIEKVFADGSWGPGGSPYHTKEDGAEFGATSLSTYTPKWLQKYCEQSPQAGPSPCCQPRETSWVGAYKIRRVKRKMAEKFQDPKRMFKAMDRDGGASLDRKELAMGLFALGVWLNPSELEMLLTTLDQDCGGDIDFGEFVSFWNNTTFD